MDTTTIKRKGRKVKTKVKRNNRLNNLKIKQKFNKDGTLKKTVTKFRGKRRVHKTKKHGPVGGGAKYNKDGTIKMNQRLKYSDI